MFLKEFHCFIKLQFFIFPSVVYNLKITRSRKGNNYYFILFSFKTSSGLEQKRDKMCVLDMDEKGDLYLYKFALLCKNEIIKRLINGSYHIAEPWPSKGPKLLGNS